MGEIRPPPEVRRRALKPNLGQQSLRQWYEDPRADSILPAIADTLIVVQQIAPFQRRIRDSASSLVVPVGQRPLFRIIVPEFEAWKFLSVDFRNGDDTTKNVLLFYDRGFSPLMPRSAVVSRVPISAGVTQPLYSAAPPRPTTSSDIFFVWMGKLEFFAGDQIEILPSTVTTRAVEATYTVHLRYEQIPSALDVELGTEWAAAIVP